jgi:hypothetical protein
MKLTWLHVPKTGGTAIKYLQHEHRTQWIIIDPLGHNMTLARMPGDRRVAFAIRDPWQRFCSGYWERATTSLRIAARRERRDQKLPDFGYRDVRNDEKIFYEKFPTPNAVITGLRDKTCVIPPRCPTEEMLWPAAHWLHDLASYKKHEHKVQVVVDMRDLDSLIHEVTGHKLPEDPFRRRSRALFDIPQSYDIDPDNQAWFRDEYRCVDYELFDYIRSRPYFRQFG